PVGRVSPGYAAPDACGGQIDGPSESARMTRSLTVAVLALALWGCGEGDPTGGLPPGDAQLAVLNALPEGTLTALVLDDDASTLPSQGTRIARVIPAGEHRLEARTEGGRSVASAHFSVAEGGRRTAI